MSYFLSFSLAPFLLSLYPFLLPSFLPIPFPLLSVVRSILISLPVSSFSLPFSYLQIFPPFLTYYYSVHFIYPSYHHSSSRFFLTFIPFFSKMYYRRTAIKEITGSMCYVILTSFTRSAPV
jgi:hypothetical protein